MVRFIAFKSSLTFFLFYIFALSSIYISSSITLSSNGFYFLPTYLFSEGLLFVGFLLFELNAGFLYELDLFFYRSLGFYFSFTGSYFLLLSCCEGLTGLLFYEFTFFYDIALLVLLL